MGYDRPNEDNVKRGDTFIGVDEKGNLRIGEVSMVKQFSFRGKAPEDKTTPLIYYHNAIIITPRGRILMGRYASTFSELEGIIIK